MRETKSGKRGPIWSREKHIWMRIIEPPLANHGVSAAPARASRSLTEISILTGQ